jgi:uncharacterized protein YndB with AHSA1/START domain
VARNEILAPVPPDAVWEVLADPRLYVSWVVGASSLREVEGRWPEPGATLHHSQMEVIRDTTTVLSAEPGRRIVLEARARPLVVARVDVRLEPDGESTRIVLEEHVVGGLARLAPDVVNEPLLRLRNAAGVRRLERLAEIGRRLDHS